jgi:hypothetical protein
MASRAFPPLAAAALPGAPMVRAETRLTGENGCSDDTPPGSSFPRRTHCPSHCSQAVWDRVQSTHHQPSWPYGCPMVCRSYAAYRVSECFRTGYPFDGIVRALDTPGNMAEPSAPRCRAERQASAFMSWTAVANQSKIFALLAVDKGRSLLVAF